jgi:AmmeMemoRadiSam system protein B/AmmeMemoRadiSam system protein A
MFYPGDARALAAEIDELLGSVAPPEPRLGYPKALIVPHAGYIYSGPVAARAFDELSAARGAVRRVVLLGPAHRVAVRGLAAPGVEAFATPLGPVRIDREALQALRDLPQVVTSDKAHAAEHALEVQLPFLQKLLGDFSLVPLVVGMAGVAEVAEVIERLWGGPETLIVVSTDLSHYHAYDEARAIDGATLGRIAALATDLDHEEACGATPLNGLLRVCAGRNLKPALLAACNSGDTAGGKDRVVGYSAFAVYDAGEVPLRRAGETLLSIARDSIDGGLSGEPPPHRAEPWLGQFGATFVTLSKNGALRGCIGTLEAARALRDDVAANALGAAFRDPRFPAMSRAEWPQCRVEVSLLTAPKPLRFGDEAELLSQIEAGVDGLIVEGDGKRGTFLPQVWEDLPDKRAFLAHLLKKAGLPADTRLSRCRISRYRVMKWKE